MNLNTEHFLHCIKTLNLTLTYLQKTEPSSSEYEIFRNAAIKGFELSLETAGKLLRKALKLYSSNPREIDDLIFKDVLRQAVKHGLLDPNAIKRWFKYRDNRNTTAHDYGIAFAEETLKLLGPFVEDSMKLYDVLTEKLGNQDA